MTTISDQLEPGRRADLAGVAESLSARSAAARTRAERLQPVHQGTPRSARPAESRSGPRSQECRTCRGQFTAAPEERGRPYGWYSISVSVPPELGKGGKPYLWVGTYCSARCLAAAMPVIVAAEVDARQGYQADRPQRQAERRTENLGALMRSAPRGR